MPQNSLCGRKDIATGRKIQKTSQKGKKPIYIAEIGASPDNLSLMKTGKKSELDMLSEGLNQSYDVEDELAKISANAKVEKLVVEDRQRKKDVNHRREQIDVSIDYNQYKQEKRDKLLKEYSSRANFRPLVINHLNDALKIIRKYRNYPYDILDGKVGSHFYTIAKDYQRQSNSVQISAKFLNSLPLNKYYGYIGSKRSNLITFQLLEDKRLRSKIAQYGRKSKVVQFWGVDGFIRYVIVPEIIAQVIKANDDLNSVLDAYEIMEQTHDYGVYIMNEKPIDKAQRESEGEETEEGLDSDQDIVILLDDTKHKETTNRTTKPISQTAKKTDPPATTFNSSEGEQDESNDLVDIFG